MFEALSIANFKIHGFTKPKVKLQKGHLDLKK